MNVIRAHTMGMCFGVRDALTRAASEKRPEETAVFGELVHNESVLRELKDRGFEQVNETDRNELPSSPRVLLTAHGVSDVDRDRLLRAGKTLVDTTCPLVVRVHDAARSFERDGYLVVVIGRADHVEVRGIVGDLAEYRVIESPSDVGRYHADRIGIVAQTTASSEVVDALRAEVARCNPHAEIRFVDTVCQPTKDRQNALEELVHRVDVVVVVGGRHSNNTKKLAERCEAAGVRAHHVQSASELDPAWFLGCDTVGLTAGTSTLDETADEVHRALLSLPTPAGV